MTSHEAALVAELLASDRIEDLYVRFLEAAMKLGASTLEVLILCHLMVEEIEQRMAPADRDAIRRMVAATDSFHPIGEAAAKVVRGSAMASTETAMLRAELLMLKTRYDHYAFSPAVYAVVKNIETEISWMEHGCGARSPRYPTLPTGRRVSPAAQGEVNA